MTSLIFSDLFPKYHPRVAADFFAALTRHGVNFELISDTKDIWARDYLPLLCEDGEACSYVYDPDYLRGREEYRTVLPPLPRHLPLVMDGGNFERIGGKAIMTDKVFTDNPGLSRGEIERLVCEKCALDELIIVPRAPYDPYGHTDGIVRFIGENGVIINDFSIERASWRAKFERALTRHELEITRLNLNKDFWEGRDWAAYLNFVKIGSLIIMPAYGLKSDEIAAEQISKAFGGCEIELVNARSLIKDGGALHCVCGEKPLI